MPSPAVAPRERILAATAQVLGRNGMTKLSLSAVASGNDGDDFLAQLRHIVRPRRQKP